MNSKQDYFRSPAPKNLQSFYSPFRLLRYDQDPLIVNNSLSPFNRNSNNYIPQHSHDDVLLLGKPMQLHEEGKKINKVLQFENQENQQCSQQINSPKRIEIKTSIDETAARKKYELRFCQSNEKSYIGHRDAFRGLRVLSKQAFQILQISSPMTYQQVADKIIQQNQQLNEFPQRKKERQSIKRRVYDALNVLIAVGLLDKNGKKILMNTKVKEQKLVQIHTRKNLNQTIGYKNALIEMKRKKLQQIKTKKLNISKLICRNKQSLNFQPKICFPFIIAKQLASNNQSTYKNVKDFLCADADSLLFLKL